MALAKNVFIDQIEITANGTVQVRNATVILEDGLEISRTYHRHCVVPGQDYSAEEQKVREHCTIAHTAEVIAAYAATIRPVP